MSHDSSSALKHEAGGVTMTVLPKALTHLRALGRRMRIIRSYAAPTRWDDPVV